MTAHAYLNATPEEVARAADRLADYGERLTAGNLSTQVARSRRMKGAREWYAIVPALTSGREHSVEPFISVGPSGREALTCPVCGSRCTTTSRGALAGGFDYVCQPKVADGEAATERSRVAA